jgi:hypothetical protein
LQALRPRAQEVRKLALRETDPRHYRRFEPIALGPFGNGALLLLVSVAAAISLPVRLAAAWLKKT